MIEIAVVLSAVVRHWPDFFIILVLLVANATIGFWEEREAGNAIEALKARLANKARVKRDGKWITSPAKDLVPGDAIRLRLGDIVPADARLLDGDEVSVDQSALTGESLPATRKTGDAIFSGSIIRRGEIDALVYATGAKTYFGKTAELVETAVTVSHFQKAVLKIGDYLIVLALVLVAVIIGFSIYRGEDILTTLQFALVLTVAAIPVAMPTVLSVTMAVGARKLAKRQAIVSKLVAIEELAGVDVLCADKTGTLTQNKLTLGEPFCLDKITPDDLILAGALASRQENDDTIDLAVLGGLKDKDALKPYQVSHFTPFDPVHKRTEATVKGPDGKSFKVTKGAPQVIQGLSANDAAVKDSVDKAVNDFAARGYRALGVARADGDGQWRMLGVLPLFDPPREDAKATIATAAEMGVKIKMVTGDALAIAREMAKTLGMGANILDGAELGDANTAETPAVAKEIEDADGFAQVFPEHKFHIVDVLQKHGHIVGMTGDGVNDAPALKKADCGFAVSGATDAARAAASIVLVEPGLSVIIDAIKESRRIFQRMNSYSIYRIAETLRVLFFMTLAILVFNFYPLTAVMIVMLALLNDGAILSIAYDNVKYRPAPESWDMRTVLTISTVLGIIGVVAAFGLFYLAERVFHLDRAHIQTLMYLKLSVAGHLTIFLTRTRGPFWSIRPARILWMAVLGTQTLATLVAVYGATIMTPLGWGWALFVWGYALAWFFFNDGLKLLAYRYLDATKKAAPKRQDEAAVGAATIDAAEPEAKSGPRTDAKPDETKPEVKSAASPASEPQPVAKAAATTTEAEPKLGPDGQTEGANVLDMKLGDVLLAGLASDPKGAGQFIAKAIAEIEAALDSTAPVPTAQSPLTSEAEAAAKPDETKPEVKPAASPASEPQPAPKADATTTEAEPEAKSGPPADAKPDESKPEAKPVASPASEPQPTPKANATTTEAEPEPGPDGQTENANVLDMKLGDVLLAAIASDPEGAGQFIAKGITEIEAGLGSTAPDPTPESPPKSEAAAKPDAKPELPPAATPGAAK
jgi:H+-transporting ATPase